MPSMVFGIVKYLESHDRCGVTKYPAHLLTAVTKRFHISAPVIIGSPTSTIVPTIRRENLSRLPSPPPTSFPPVVSPDQSHPSYSLSRTIYLVISLTADKREISSGRQLR